MKRLFEMSSLRIYVQQRDSGYNFSFKIKTWCLLNWFVLLIIPLSFQYQQVAVEAGTGILIILADFSVWLPIGNYFVLILIAHSATIELGLICHLFPLCKQPCRCRRSQQHPKRWFSDGARSPEPPHTRSLSLWKALQAALLHLPRLVQTLWWALSTLCPQTTSTYSPLKAWMTIRWHLALQLLSNLQVSNRCFTDV